MGVLLTLFLYLIQQSGVLLGAGAAALGLFWYLRDFDRPQPHHSLRATRVSENIGLMLMILSGIGIVALHWSVAAFSILFAPAFLFKWLLIVVLVVCSVPRRKTQNTVLFATLEGCSGGSWLALLLINFLAPVTTWTLLLSLYAVWMIFFALVWAGCLLLLHHERIVKVSTQ